MRACNPIGKAIVALKRLDISSTQASAEFLYGKNLLMTECYPSLLIAARFL